MLLLKKKSSSNANLHIVIFLILHLNQENFENIIEILLRYRSHKKIKGIITAANTQYKILGRKY